MCSIVCHVKCHVSHRLFCPRNCLHDSYARIIGTRYYADVSSLLWPHSPTNIRLHYYANARPITHKTYRLSPLLSQKSSICRAAIHAGVIKSESGGYLDVMPVDRRRQYSGSYQNGITSERYCTKGRLEMPGKQTTQTFCGLLGGINCPTSWE